MLFAASFFTCLLLLNGTAQPQPQHDDSLSVSLHDRITDSLYESRKRSESAFYDQTTPLSMAFVGLINIYQRTMSAREGKSSCQFRPSCSHYAATAIKEYGIIEGTLMAADRILRCNPGAHEFYPLWTDSIHLCDSVGDHHL